MRARRAEAGCARVGVMTGVETAAMRVIIAGGGTGGHLYPGIAIAEEITRRPGGEVLFVGTARGLEAKLVPAAGFPLETLEVSGLKRTGVAGLVRGLDQSAASSTKRGATKCTTSSPYLPRW